MKEQEEQFKEWENGPGFDDAAHFEALKDLEERASVEDKDGTRRMSKVKLIGVVIEEFTKPEQRPAFVNNALDALFGRR